MFRTTTTYVPYHKNICSDPIRVLFFPARGRHRLLIDSLYYGYTCPCCHSHTSSSPQYIVALHISNASAASISTHHCGAWLRTEYDTAVIRAHNAADWQSFLRNKDVMPNLRWMPTTSPNPESSHEAYWKAKLTLPVDDPFWSKHHPGDRWNCKCSLEQTDDPVNRPADLDGVDPPQRGLENNPGKDGHTFSDNHPYYPASCSVCPFNKGSFKNRLLSSFSNHKKGKDCNNCPKVDKKLPSNPQQGLC